MQNAFDMISSQFYELLVRLYETFGTGEIFKTGLEVVELKAHLFMLSASDASAKCRCICVYFYSNVNRVELPLKMIFTVRNEVAKVMFLHLSVCPWGGRSASVQGYYPPPPEQAPPSARKKTPRDQAPPQQTATDADCTHPTGMHSSCMLGLYFLIRWSFLFGSFLCLCHDKTLGNCTD